MIVWKIVLSEKNRQDGSTEFTCAVTNEVGTKRTGKGKTPSRAYNMACAGFIGKPWLINLDDADRQCSHRHSVPTPEQQSGNEGT